MYVCMYVCVYVKLVEGFRLWPRHASEATRSQGWEFKPGACAWTEQLASQPQRLLVRACVRARVRACVRTRGDQNRCDQGKKKLEAAPTKNCKTEL